MRSFRIEFPEAKIYVEGTHSAALCENVMGCVDEAREIGEERR